MSLSWGWGFLDGDRFAPRARASHTSWAREAGGWERHGRGQDREIQGHLQGGKAQNILGLCLGQEGVSSPPGKQDGRSPDIISPITVVS